MLQVQPDMEELTENAEDIAEEGDSKQSEVKLGKLQYKVGSFEKERQCICLLYTSRCV